MALNFNRQKLDKGINFTAINDPRFKTNYMTVTMITNITKEFAAKNAIIPLVLSKSNANYPSVTEINRKLSSLYGANLSGDAHKIGDSHAVTLSASCIADTYTFEGEKITADLATILIDCLLNPNLEDGEFAPKNFALNKQELIDDIDAEINEKRSYAILRAGKKIFEGEPAAVPANGDKDQAEKLTPLSAYEQYKHLLKTAQIEIFFVGGGNPSEALERFTTAFKNLDRNFDKNCTSTKSTLKSEVLDIVETLDIAQSKMVMGFKTNTTNTPAIKLMNAIFGGTPFSKLFLNVREKLSLCYYCAARYDERKGVLLVDSGVESDNILKAREEIMRQLDDMTKGNFSQEDINDSLLSIVNDSRTINDSPYSIASWYLRQAYNGTAYTPEEEINRIKAVSREDIINAAASLKLDTVFVLTKKGGEN